MSHFGLWRHDMEMETEYYYNLTPLDNTFHKPGHIIYLIRHRAKGTLERWFGRPWYVRTLGLDGVE